MKIKPLNIIIGIIIILQFQVFYLVPETYNFDYYSIIIFSLVVFIKYSKVKREPTLFGKVFVLLIGTAILGSVVSKVLFDVPLSISLWSQKWILIYGLFYFSINLLIKKNKLTYESIVKIIYFVGTLQLIVYITQYILGNTFIFTHILSGQRYDSFRFYFNPILLILLFFICLSRTLNNQKVFINIIYLIAIAFEIMVVNKYRMSTLALIVSFSLIICIFNGDVRKKLFVFIIGSFILIQISNLEIFQDIIASIFANDVTDTVNGRNAFRNWAVQNVVLEGNIFGMGIVMTESQNIYANNYIFNHYYIGDHGIWGMLYEYGIPIIFVTLIILFKMVINSMEKLQIDTKYIFIGFALFILIDSYSENYWFLSPGLSILTLALNMLELQVKKHS